MYYYVNFINWWWKWSSVILWALPCQYSSLYERERWGQSRCEQKWEGSRPLFSGEGQITPAAFSLLYILTHAHELKRAYTWNSHCCHLFVLFLRCECARWAGNALFTSSMSSLYPPPFHSFSFQSLSFSLPLSLAGSFSCPRLFYSHFLTPAPIPPSVFYLTSYPPSRLFWCACWCVTKGGGGWLVVGGLDRHLILALPHNVGMCNLFKIRFPRWVLSLAMVSTIMRVYTVVLLSLPLSLCLLCLAMTLLYMNLQFFPSLSGGGGSNSSKSLQAMAAVHVSQQVTVKRQTALELTRSEWKDRQIRKKDDRRGQTWGSRWGICLVKPRSLSITVVVALHDITVHTKVHKKLLFFF